ncbi:MAG TPA: hypothetical protein VHY35_04705 [Stellaceae bacterium]|jgi:flagellar biosynthesis/type III secretory pathway chaperone|nr:hypothetical protein [Stellaceae bacterium]
MDVNSGALVSLIDELRDLLVEEREALLSGGPERLTDVVQRKLALAEAIEHATNDVDMPQVQTDAIASLDRYNRENAIICAAILRHLTDALDTLRQQNPHRSYKLDGTEEKSAPVPHALGAA